MPQKFHKSLHFSIALIAMLTVFASAIVQYVVRQRLEEAISVATIANSVPMVLAESISILKDAETAQRGFLLTGKDEYLEPYHEAKNELPAYEQRLAELADERKNDVAEWKRLADLKLSELQRTIDARKTGGLEAALAIIDTGEGKETMDKLRKVNDGLMDFYTRELDARREERGDQLRRTTVWTTATALAGIAASLTALVLYRVAQRHATAEEMIERRAEIAEEVGQQKSVFLANMSHEIRTPMNAILGFTELLESEPLSDRQQTYIHSIKQAGRSLVQLINDILDLTKVEAGMIEFHPEPVDLRDAGEFVRTVIGQACSAKGLDLRIDFPSTLPRALLLDEGRVRQVLVNLAGNAQKYTERGYIRVAAEAAPHSDQSGHYSVKFTVEDTGIGIAPERLKDIFDPFVQADSRRNIDKQGTGLGLSIVKRLTEMMGGTVTVESQQGRGSIFTVFLPDVEVAAQQPASVVELTSDSDTNMNDFQPSRILIVDDNPVNRDLLAGIFSNTHHQVQFAANGREALDVIAGQKPGLVLMDVRMPVMTGTQAVQALRTNPETEGIPVIAVTASSLLHEEGGVRRHFSAYLRKPFSRAELYREIAQFIPRPHKTGKLNVRGLSQETPVSDAHNIAWHTAIRKLKQMESSSWQALRRSLAIGEARSFAERLLLISEAADCPPLKAYAEVLRNHAANFAADELEHDLAAFPDLIALLEERTVEH